MWGKAGRVEEACDRGERGQLAQARGQGHGRRRVVWGTGSARCRKSGAATVTGHVFVVLALVPTT